MKGKIHSFQSLGTVDGPGVRFVVFMQGCHLRCGCCHNPDTWEISDGEEFEAQDVVHKITRYREYFGNNGGVTVSGGEPLLQASFVKELFSLCHEKGIHTCLDTSGSVFNEDVKNLLAVTDRVLLDVKYTSDELYRKHVGCSLECVIFFLEYLNGKNIPVTVRQVIIPTINDSEQDALQLRNLLQPFSCIDSVELLPFKKICTTKYNSMNLAFPFGHLPEPSEKQMKTLENILIRL